MQPLGREPNEKRPQRLRQRALGGDSDFSELRESADERQQTLRLEALLAGVVACSPADEPHEDRAPGITRTSTAEARRVQISHRAHARHRNIGLRVSHPRRGVGRQNARKRQGQTPLPERIVRIIESDGLNSEEPRHLVRARRFFSHDEIRLELAGDRDEPRVPNHHLTGEPEPGLRGGGQRKVVNAVRVEKLNRAFLIA